MNLSGGPLRVLATGIEARATGLAADDDHRRLFWVSVNGPDYTLKRAAYTLTGPLTIENVGTLSQIVLSLAYDPLENLLIGKMPGGIVGINPDTAATTFTYLMTGQNFDGMDYDRTTDAIYAVNNSSLTTTLPGRGVYRINRPWNNPTFTRISMYPSGVMDIDGVAVGNGRLYLAENAPGEFVHVLNLTTLQYETALPLPLQRLSANVGAGWAPGLLAEAGNADIRVQVTGPANCAQTAGELATYTITLDNLGPESSNGVTLQVTLPTGATFVSAVPPLTPSGQTITWPIGVLAPGQGRTLTVSLLPIGPGTLNVQAAGTSSTGDPDLNNNTATFSSTFASPPPSAAFARGVFSTVATSPSSLVPGVSGVRFSAVGGIGRPYKSESGANWILVADTDAPAASDSMIIRGDASSFSVAAREGTSPLLPTQPNGTHLPFGSFDPGVGINDQGVFAFSGLDDRSTTTDDGYVVKWDGFQYRLIAQEGSPAAAVGPNVAWGGSRGSVSVRADGQTSFSHSLSGAGVSASTDAGLFTDDGASLVARKGVSVPAGQANGGTYTWKSFDTPVTPGFGLSVDQFGVHWSVTGAINAPTTTPPPGGLDRVAVVDQSVAFQENSPTIMGVNARDTTPFTYLHTEPDGAWMAMVSLTDGTDAIVRNYSPVARTGDVISVNSTSHWAAPASGSTFFMALSNRLGDFLLGGYTDEPGLGSGALVFNVETVVLRTNAPVDLDGNGIFDDGAYIKSFVSGANFLSDERTLYAVVRLRSAAAALCPGTPDDDIGQALIRVQLAQPPQPCDPDLNDDGNVDQADIDYLINVIGGGDNPTNADPDFNHDGNADQGDVDVVINVIAGGPCP